MKINNYGLMLIVSISIGVSAAIEIDAEQINLPISEDVEKKLGEINTLEQIEEEWPLALKSFSYDYQRILLKKVLEINNPNSEQFLKKIFWEFPSCQFPNQIPRTKLDIIKTLSKLKTDESKIVIIEIINKYILKKPDETKQPPYEVNKEEYILVLKTGIEELIAYKDIKDINKLLNDISNNQAVDKQIKQTAKASEIRLKLLENRYESKRSELTFLINQLDPTGNNIDQNQSVLEVLQSYNGTYISELEEILHNHEEDSPVWRIIKTAIHRIKLQSEATQTEF